MKNQKVNIVKQAEVVNKFLKFAYNFPLDIQDRFTEYYGKSLGSHFYKKYRGQCKKRENNFIAMVYTYGEMDTSNQQLFMQLVNDYYEATPGIKASTK